MRKGIRIMRLQGWTNGIRGRQRSRVEHCGNVATRSDERWTIDFDLVHLGMTGWHAFVPVIDSFMRQVLGWELAATAKADRRADLQECAPGTLRALRLGAAKPRGEA